MFLKQLKTSNKRITPKQTSKMARRYQKYVSSKNLQIKINPDNTIKKVLK